MSCPIKYNSATMADSTTQNASGNVYELAITLEKADLFLDGDQSWPDTPNTEVTTRLTVLQESDDFFLAVDQSVGEEQFSVALWLQPDQKAQLARYFRQVADMLDREK